MHHTLQPKQLLWLNTIGYILMLLTSFEGATGFIGGVTIPMIGETQGQTLLTPAPYAFSIWGLIYLLIAGYIVFQWRQFKAGDNSQSLLPSGLWFALSCVFYVTWILTWLKGFIWLPFLAMVSIFYCLWQLVKNLKLQFGNPEKSIVFWVWYPIAIYIGWVTLALSINTVVVLQSIFTQPPFFSGVTWAILALALITSIYLLYDSSRDMYETSLVGVWGFIAIAVEQWSVSRAIALFALVSAGILAMVFWANYRNTAVNKLIGTSKV